MEAAIQTNFTSERDIVYRSFVNYFKLMFKLVPRQ